MTNEITAQLRHGSLVRGLTNVRAHSLKEGPAAAGYGDAEPAFRNGAWSTYACWIDSEEYRIWCYANQGGRAHKIQGMTLRFRPPYQDEFTTSEDGRQPTRPEPGSERAHALREEDERSPNEDDDRVLDKSWQVVISLDKHCAAVSEDNVSLEVLAEQSQVDGTGQDTPSQSSSSMPQRNCGAEKPNDAPRPDDLRFKRSRANGAKSEARLGIKVWIVSGGDLRLLVEDYYLYVAKLMSQQLKLREEQCCVAAIQERCRRDDNAKGSADAVIRTSARLLRTHSACDRRQGAVRDLRRSTGLGR